MTDHSNNDGNNNNNEPSQQNTSYRNEPNQTQQSHTYYTNQTNHGNPMAGNSNFQQAQPQQTQAHFQQQQQHNTHYSQQPGYGQYPPSPNGYQYSQQIHVTKKTNTKSIVSLILGCLSIIIPYIGFFIGIAGIIVSSISLKELKRQPEDGKGLAVSGLVTAIIGTVIWGIIDIIVVLVFIFAFSDYNNNYYY